MRDQSYINTSLRQSQRMFLVLGLIGVILCVIAVLTDRRFFMASYLEAYLFWLGITLGCMALLMIHNLVGGNWGWLIRPFLESGSWLIWLMPIFFVPILFGMHDLYRWTLPDGLVGVSGITHKKLYFNPNFWIGRLILFFVAWGGIRYLLIPNPLIATSHKQRRRLQLRSGLGLVCYGLTISVAAVDWVQSIDLRWDSNMFGLILAIGELLGAMAFLIVMIAWLRSRLAQVDYPVQSLHDCGNLLLVFTMFFTYVSFGQFIIIFSGQLPSDYRFYHERASGGWGYIGWSLVILEFFAPFLLLLFRRVKRNLAPIIGVAALLLFMRLVDHIWMIDPWFHGSTAYVPWRFLVALLALGGIWLFFFLSRLDATSLLDTSRIFIPTPHGHGHEHVPAPVHNAPPQDRMPQDRPRGDKR